MAVELALRKRFKASVFLQQPIKLELSELPEFKVDLVPDRDIENMQPKDASIR